MKIGIVAPEFPPQLGGVQTYTIETARELGQRGHEVVVFAPRDADPCNTLPFRVCPELQVRTYLDLPRLRRETVDVWHGSNANCAWLVELGRPVTVTAHGNDFLTAYSPFHRLDLRERWHLAFGSRADFLIMRARSRWRLRQDLPRVDRIFTNSRYTQDRLEKRHPGCASRTSVAGVGVARHFFGAPLSARRPGPMRLATAGRLDEPRKNIAAVLEALGALRLEFRFEFTVLGEGSFRPHLEALVRKLGLQADVHFVGRVSDAQLAACLRETDLFVLTPTETANSFEGFGLVYLEANACGAPVLAARTGGIAEAVADGTSGFFVAAPTPAEIARSLRRFFMGEIAFDRSACRTHAAQFTWSRVIDRMESHLLALAGTYSSGRTTPANPPFANRP